MRLLDYIALPPTITRFEARYLARLNRVGLVFFALHVPALMAVAAAAGTGVGLALMLSSAVMVGPVLAYHRFANPRAVSVVHGITAMLMGALLVHFGQGPVQIEMHFYFFALLAMLCMFANPMVNLVAAGTVAVHHLVVWLVLPSSVFNYDAQWWVVLVHASFVILETVAACYISREFFDNVIGLERIVQARTQTLHEKQRDMRLILDNIESGLLTIDLKGRLSSEHSRVVEQWFGAPPAGESMAHWMAARDARFAEWLDLGLESLRDGLLPTEVCMGQLPTQLQHAERTYAVSYQPIAAPASSDDAEVGGTQTAGPEQLLVILSDITERLLAEARDRRQAELLSVMQHLTRDRSSVQDFLAESESLLGALREAAVDDLVVVKRGLHTLKGNAGIFGLHSIAELCHELETRVEDLGAVPSSDAMRPLFAAWDELRQALHPILGGDPSASIELAEKDHDALLRAIRSRTDHDALESMVASLRLEPARRRLARLGQQITGLAARLGKGPIQVQLRDHGVLLDRGFFQPFWSALVHVLRNTVDHGIEDADSRRAAGKPETPTVLVSTSLQNNQLVMSVEDDGPGVNWARLAERARLMGLRVDDSPESLGELLFANGVSAKDSVNETSGRGVGMGAVREACRALGGAVQVFSRPQQGTRLEFIFPGGAHVYCASSAVSRTSQPLQPA